MGFGVGVAGWVGGWAHIGIGCKPTTAPITHAPAVHELGIGSNPPTTPITHTCAHLKLFKSFAHYIIDSLCLYIYIFILYIVISLFYIFTAGA